VNDDLNVFDDAPVATEAGLSRLQQMFERRMELDRRVEELKAELKQKEADLRKIDELDFPELFDEVGVTGFSVGNRHVTLEEKLYGSLPKEPEECERALETVRSLGGESIIKTNVAASFGKGESTRAKVAAQMLADAGFPVSVSEGIHASTYQAWVREMLANGHPLDLDELGIYNRRFVKIK
jgi:hypothetical protein